MSAYGTNNRAPKEIPNLNFDLQVQSPSRSPKRGISKPLDKQVKTSVEF